MTVTITQMTVIIERHCSRASTPFMKTVIKDLSEFFFLCDT